MTEHESHHDDFLDGVLGADSAPRPSDALRAAVLSQTVGVIRFRRRMKKCVLAASLLGCYLAGVATTTLWQPAQGPLPSPAAIVATAEPTATEPTEPPAMRRPSQPSRQNSPVARPVGSPRKNRVQTMREKADRHLLEQGDVASALRDYTCALNLAPASQRAIRPEQDTWLLMALKNARAKELRHERVNQN